MKRKLWLVSLLLIIVIPVACGPATKTDTANTPEPGGALEVMPETTAGPPSADAPADPTAVPLPEPDAGEAYPPPTTPPMTGEYPAPEAPATAPDPYPEAVDGYIWMLLPVGVQCEEDAALYTDLQDAVAGLTAVNVQTNRSEIVELNVCAACGCPTSAHYRVQVSVDDVNAAQSLGWTREP